MRALALACIMSVFAAPVEALGFCWLKYDYAGRAGQSGWAGLTGWRTDYPMAAWNLAEAFEEITGAQVDWATDDHGNTRPVVVLVDIEDAGDTTLYTCPMVYTQDVGTMALSAVGVSRMRDYLDKGGVLWLDDSWGRVAWDGIRAMVQQVAPRGWFLPETPLALRSMLYTLPVDAVQIPDVRSWRPTAGQLTEGDDAGAAVVAVVVNDAGWPMVVICHDTDYADPWARQSSRSYFSTFAPAAFAYGVNIWLYLMSH